MNKSQIFLLKKYLQIFVIIEIDIFRFLKFYLKQVFFNKKDSKMSDY